MGGGVDGSEGSGDDNYEGQVKRRRLVAEVKNEGNDGIRVFFFWGGGARKKFIVHSMSHGVSMHHCI